MHDQSLILISIELFEDRVSDKTIVLNGATGTKCDSKLVDRRSQSSAAIKSHITCKGGKPIGEEGTKPLTLGQLRMAFYFLIVGWTLAIMEYLAVESRVKVKLVLKGSLKPIRWQ